MAEEEAEGSSTSVQCFPTQVPQNKEVTSILHCILCKCYKLYYMNVWIPQTDQKYLAFQMFCGLKKRLGTPGLLKKTATRVWKGSLSKDWL